MKKEIVRIANGIYRITTLGERWYAREVLSPGTGLPEFQFFPSTTWIAGCYPKGIGYFKWLAEHGWDEAEALKNAAGEKGSKVHYACTDVDLGRPINIQETKYENPSTKQMETLGPEEIECVSSYIDFVDEYQPVMLANEITGFSDISGGTVDKIFAVANKLAPQVRQIWILDIKTSKYIWESHKLQISDYSHMNIDYKKLGITEEEWAGRKLFILQVGYKLNKAGYKLTEIEDCYDDFRNVAYRIWQKENPNARPKEAEYPLILQSNIRVAQVKKEDEEVVEEVAKEKVGVKKVKKT